VTTVHVPFRDSAGFGDAVEELLRLGVDGVAVVAGHDEASQAALAASTSIPVVIVQGRGDAGVSIDQASGARQATDHLLQLGHRVIGHVAGPQEWAEARDRTRGWQEALKAAGIAPGPTHVGNWSAASGHDAGRLLAVSPCVTAVFAANDQMAMGVVRAMVEAGRRVPEDVSVVGFDDSPEAPYLLPPLTTVHQDFAELGRCVLRVLQAAMIGGTPPMQTLRPTLVVRASTGAVHVSDQALP
jgi:DNA-binding LacI/PurR family transcriptional regulator